MPVGTDVAVASLTSAILRSPQVGSWTDPDLVDFFTAPLALALENEFPYGDSSLVALDKRDTSTKVVDAVGPTRRVLATIRWPSGNDDIGVFVAAEELVGSVCAAECAGAEWLAHPDVPSNPPAAADVAAVAQAIGSGRGRLLFQGSAPVLGADARANLLHRVDTARQPTGRF